MGVCFVVDVVVVCLFVLFCFDFLSFSLFHSCISNLNLVIHQQTMSSTKPRIFFTCLSTEGTQPALDPMAENTFQEDFELITRRMVEKKPELWDTIQGSVTYPEWEPEQRRLLEKARNLKVVCSLGVGTNHLDLDYWKSRGIPIGYTPTAVTDATADMAFALILTTVCRIKKGLLLLYAKKRASQSCFRNRKKMEQRSTIYLKGY